MRIAMVHSFYSEAQPSGENRVVEDQATALADAGHEVLLVRRDTDAVQKPLYGPRTAVNVLRGGGFDPTDQLRAFDPDVVHIQNLFPNIGTNWVAKWSGPLVVSLHNYRAVCSNGLFFRDSEICTECAGRTPAPALRHRCYRGSTTATLPVALSRGRFRENVLERADKIITTSELSDEVLKATVKADLPTVIIPNFGPEHALMEAGASTPSNRWIALGRFSPEKGFLELVRHWPDDEHLIVVGSGPLDEQIRREAAGRPITVEHTIPRDEMRSMLSTSLGLIFPSRWFESDPQVIVEAAALGVPVVAYRVNSAARFVVQTGAGATYEDHETLRTALASVRAHRDEMGGIARAEFERRWTKAAWLGRVESVYRELAYPDAHSIDRY